MEDAPYDENEWGSDIIDLSLVPLPENPQYAVLIKDDKLNECTDGKKWAQNMCINLPCSLLHSIETDTRLAMVLGIPVYSAKRSGFDLREPVVFMHHVDPFLMTLMDIKYEYTVPVIIDTAEFHTWEHRDESWWPLFTPDTVKNPQSEPWRQLALHLAANALQLRRCDMDFFKTKQTDSAIIICVTPPVGRTHIAINTRKNFLANVQNLASAMMKCIS